MSHRITLVAWLVVLGALFGQAAALASDPPPAPRLERRAAGLQVTSLPAIFDDAEVQTQLGSGLTTTFVFQLNGRDSSGLKIQGAARVEVRYEPWDELYSLAALGMDAHVVRHEESSFEALVARWRALRLTLLTPEIAARAPSRLRLQLEVVPFSRSEQRDTQRWFSESMDRTSTGNAEQAASVSEDRSETLGEVFNLLLATSIGRPALRSYLWQIDTVDLRSRR